MRTTPTAVGKIIELDPTITDITPFIDIASELVTEICVPAGYTDSRLEMIERWLAAHFYAIRDPRYASEKAGSVGASYQHEVGLNLAVTTYGQQAMILDTKGGLANLNKSTELGRARKVSITHLGNNCR